MRIESHSHVGRRWSWLLWGAVSLAVAAAVAAMSAGVATASTAAPRLAASMRVAPRPGLGLARAPAGLRAAVRRTLGVRAASGGWSQQAELTASDGDDFGDSVAISGPTAVVGSPGNNSLAGAAYVFVRSGKAWSEQAELTAFDGAAGDAFGFSVAISHSSVVIGAAGKDSGSGAAYVFVRSGKTWSQRAELAASDGAADDFFGAAVGISGSTVVVGADGHNSGTGAAYVFVRSGKMWSERAELTAFDGAAGDAFGFSVAISHSSVVIGAAGKDSGSGAAYVFVRSGKTWSQRAELAASDGAADDFFGFSVAISHSTVVVGAPFSTIGTAYVFVRSGKTWSQQAELTASDGAAGDNFGYGVAISHSTVVVGSPSHNSNMGATYVFVRSGKTWSQQSELTASDGAAGDSFGCAVAIYGSTAVVGASSHNSTGAAYVLVR